jgi:anti-sigma28 factor (negative regulator of flagellin synthesis)
MSIDPVNISSEGIDPAQATQPNEVAPNASEDQQVSPGSDSVALPAKAKELDQLASTVDQSRAEHLNKVREALESDTYEVSATTIAEKLIDANKK